jgi:hypothetical protein
MHLKQDAAVKRKKNLEEILEDNISREHICIMRDFKAHTGKDRNGLHGEGRETVNGRTYCPCLIEMTWWLVTNDFKNGETTR